METSLIVYLLVFLVVVFLIFKLIKKIAVAIFTVFFVIVLIFAGIGTMAYFDYKDIIEADNFELNIVYGDVSSPNFGIMVPYENEEFTLNSIADLDVSNLNEDSVEEDEENFYIFVDENVVENMLSENETYSLLGTESWEYDGIKININLSKEDILDILDSDDSNSEYIQILLDNNPQLNGQLSAEDLETALVNPDMNVEMKHLIFASVLFDSGKQGAVGFVKGFKEKEVNVYPEKFSFKFLRFLPIDTLANMIVVDMNNE